MYKVTEGKGGTHSSEKARERVEKVIKTTATTKKKFIHDSKNALQVKDERTRRNLSSDYV